MPQSCYYKSALTSSVNWKEWMRWTGLHAHPPTHAHMHAHGVCRPWCVDVVWELFSGRGFDFSIKTLQAPCHYRGRRVSGFQQSDTVDEPLQLRDTPLIRDWLRQSIAWSWPGLLKIRHSSTACSFFFNIFKPLCTQTASPLHNCDNGHWFGLRICSI